MKKKNILKYAIFTMLIIVLCGCGKEKLEKSLYRISDINNITLNIEEIKRTSAIIKIKDTNGQGNVYGEWYAIEKEIDDSWYQLDTIRDDYFFNDIGYLPNQNSEVEFIINWEQLYGSLEDGNYRMLKQVNNEYIAVQFTIKSTTPTR